MTLARIKAQQRGAGLIILEWRRASGACLQPSSVSSAGRGRRSADTSVHGSRKSDAATSVASDPSMHGPRRTSAEDTSAPAAPVSLAAPGPPAARGAANGGIGASTRGGSVAVGALHRGGSAGPPDADPDDGPDSAPTDARLLSQVPITLPSRCACARPPRARCMHHLMSQCEWSAIQSNCRCIRTWMFK